VVIRFETTSKHEKERKNMVKKQRKQRPHFNWIRPTHLVADTEDIPRRVAL